MIFVLWEFGNSGENGTFPALKKGNFGPKTAGNAKKQVGRPLDDPWGTARACRRCRGEQQDVPALVLLRLLKLSSNNREGFLNPRLRAYHLYLNLSTTRPMELWNEWLVWQVQG